MRAARRRERRVVSRDARGVGGKALGEGRERGWCVEDDEGICCQRQSRTNDAADPALPPSGMHTGTPPAAGTQRLHPITLQSWMSCRCTRTGWRIELDENPRWLCLGMWPSCS
jgi:hypothetical protein